ncbi:MAG: helix-turn-helix domain-containing protein [Sphingomonadales bacterium]|nr:helix-turn-helix domain-containing protein [Sphingomonadales bacterium]
MTTAGRPKIAASSACPTPSEIEQARHNAGLSQEEAAFRAGVGRRTWQRWERGVNGMPPRTWELWRASLGNPGTTAVPLPPSPVDIRDARRRLLMTQDAAARRVSVSTRTWQSWEAGDAKMPGALWHLFRS